MLLLAVKEGGSWKSMLVDNKVQISGQDLGRVLRRPSAAVPGLIQQRNRQFCLAIVLPRDLFFPLGKVPAQFVVIMGARVCGWLFEVTVCLLADVPDLGLEVLEVPVDGGLSFRGAKFVVLEGEVEVGAGEEVFVVALLLDEGLNALYLCEDAADEGLKLLLQVGVDGLQLLVVLPGRCQLRLVPALAFEHALDLPLQEAVVVLQVFVLAQHRLLHLAEVVLVAGHCRQRGAHVAPALLVGRGASQLAAPCLPPRSSRLSRLPLAPLPAEVRLQMRRAGFAAGGPLLLAALRLTQQLLLQIGMH